MATPAIAPQVSPIPRLSSRRQPPQYPAHNVIATGARELEQLAALGRRMLRPVDAEPAVTTHLPPALAASAPLYKLAITNEVASASAFA